jgi:hypothetical protein
MTLTTLLLALHAALPPAADLPGLGTMALVSALVAAASMIAREEPAPATIPRRGR